MSDPFGDLLGMFGMGHGHGLTPNKENEELPIYENPETGEFHLLLLKVPGLIAAYLAVPLDNADDRQPFGRPVTVIIHSAEYKEYYETQANIAHQGVQGAFLGRVKKFYEAQGETKVVARGFLRIRQRSNPWADPMFSYNEDGTESDTPPECPKEGECKAHNMPMFTLQARVEHEDLIPGFCQIHQDLINVYLLDPNTEDTHWPPEPEEATDDDAGRMD